MERWGQTDALFGSVIRTLNETLSTTNSNGGTMHTTKTLIDRFRRIMQKRRDKVAANFAASGIEKLNKGTK